MEHITVGKWGNSLAIRLPHKFAKALGIKEGDRLPPEVLSYGALLRARLDAERLAKRKTPEEAEASIIAARDRWPKDLKPEDWKIDRNSDDARG